MSIEKNRCSKRGEEWNLWSYLVFEHIEKYTVPQYGDKGDDQCTHYEVRDFMKQIQKYANRQGKNSRPGQDQLDLLKIAHYAQMTWTKLEELKCLSNKEDM